MNSPFTSKLSIETIVPIILPTVLFLLLIIMAAIFGYKYYKARQLSKKMFGKAPSVQDINQTEAEMLARSNAAMGVIPALPQVNEQSTYADVHPSS